MISTKPLVAVIGSSVALGCYAPDQKGWTWMLGQHLRSVGFDFENLSISGSNTHDAIQQFHNRVVLMKPRVVIIGLSLANEGMDVDSFLSNMKYLISDVKKLGAACMLGSVYPNNYYTRAEYEMLLSTHKEMIKWKQDEIIDALFDFMVLDDGKGHWKSSCYADAGHPNEVGHKIMFESIDLNIFSRFRPAHSKM